MADIELVIKIPDYEYKHIREYYEKNDNVEATYSHIYYGTPLPKGHGDLIDRNVAREAMMFEMSGTGYQSRAMSVLNSEIYTPTIIEGE